MWLLLYCPRQVPNPYSIDRYFLNTTNATKQCTAGLAWLGSMGKATMKVNSVPRQLTLHPGWVLAWGLLNHSSTPSMQLPTLNFWCFLCTMDAMVHSKQRIARPFWIGSQIWYIAGREWLQTCQKAVISIVDKLPVVQPSNTLYTETKALAPPRAILASFCQLWLSDMSKLIMDSFYNTSIIIN